MTTVPIARFTTVDLQPGQVLDLGGSSVGTVDMLDDTGTPSQVFQIAAQNVIGPYATVKRFRINATATQAVEYTIRVTVADDGDRLRRITDATYTVQASDAGKLLRFINGCTITLPDNLPAGFQCMWVQLGADPLVFTGSTIRNVTPGATVSAGQYAEGYVRVDEPGVWFLGGSVEAP